METWDDPVFHANICGADLVVPDGLPLVWALKLLGIHDACHVRGQDLVLAVCGLAEQRALRVAIYGSTRDSLILAERNLLSRFPRLDIRFIHSPPFNEISEKEDREIVAAMREAAVQLLFVSLGCPKQEKWMAEHQDRVGGVMIGAGAAIDMIAGSQPVAPRWMQNAGLEWLFRLASDPRRLWRRYAKHNLRFLYLFGRQWMTAVSGRLPKPARPERI
jgi:N-acetylglucosaminyldiphosphoundecaprenol N-acetyl-beta-D-mannosaminyltransferase